MSSSYDSAIIDTAMIHHPDLLRVSSAARFLWVEGMVYSKLHKTDGRIEKHAIRLVSVEPDAEIAAASLVAVGRWLDEGDAWVIVGFLDSQWSAERVAKQREQSRARLDRFRDNELKRVSGRVSSASKGRAHVQRDGMKRVSASVDPTRPEGEGGSARSAPPSADAPGVAPRAPRKPMSEETKAKAKATREATRIEREKRERADAERRAAEQKARDNEWLSLGGSPDALPVSLATLSAKKYPGRKPLR